LWRLIVAELPRAIATARISVVFSSAFSITFNAPMGRLAVSRVENSAMSKSPDAFCLMIVWYCVLSWNSTRRMSPQMRIFGL
jgi:hypothetical protein